MTRSGHAAQPGSGPAGETCGSCDYLVDVVDRDGLFDFSYCEHYRREFNEPIGKHDLACRYFEAPSEWKPADG